MRTTDDLNPERFQPLGEKVPPKPKDVEPEWKQRPGAAKGVEENRDGQLRTNIPQNYGCF
jgi:hypothetical protein